MTILNIKEFGLLIKQSLPKTNIQLKAEVRQPKLSNGHLYLNLKDATGIVNAIVWKSSMTENIKYLKDGDTVTIYGKLDYYNGNGRLSLIINNLIETEGKGELYKLYENTKKYYKNEGYFLNENKLKVGKIIKKILLLTSENGDALKDFYHCIENNNCILNQDFLSVSVQGTNCPSDICKILNSNDIYENNYSLIVLTRGGGSFEDLFGFCQRELIESVHNCRIPILSAIGHKNDTTLVDYVADYVAATPSLAAQFIVNHNLQYIQSLQVKDNNLQNILKSNILKSISHLDNTKNNLYNYKDILDVTRNKLQNKISQQINEKLLDCERYMMNYKLDDNIKLYNNKLEIKTHDELILSLKNKEDIKILIDGKIVNIREYL